MQFINCILLPYKKFFFYSFPLFIAQQLKHSFSSFYLSFIPLHIFIILKCNYLFQIMLGFIVSVDYEI